MGREWSRLTPLSGTSLLKVDRYKIYLAKVTMEEWMGCGSMDETHIKVDTGDIMSGKWSGVTGLGLSL